MNASKEFLERFYREQAEQKAKTDKLRRALMRALVAAKVKRVSVGFDGYGDSGNVGEIKYEPAPKDFGKRSVDDTPHKVVNWSDDGKCSESVRDYTFDELVEEVCYGILEGSHPGWEINEGAFGDIVIDPAKDTVAMTFNQRVESYETSEEEY